MVKIYGYGVDVASYQPQAVTKAWWTKTGASYAVVKLTENENYTNPYAKAQIAGAKAAGISVHGYHFARFTESASDAKVEANYAVSKAKALGLPQGAILVLDFELGAGNKSLNDTAINTFLKIVKGAGYTPAFYSYSGMSSHYDSNDIYKESGATTWIAAYPAGNGKRADTPNFNYFPSVGNNISAWQFTDNWKGLKVDASADLTGLWVAKAKTSTSKPKVTTLKPKTTVTKVKATVKKVTVKTYVVKSGDTLSGIGKKVGKDWKKLASENKLKAPYTIYPGQKIKY